MRFTRGLPHQLALLQSYKDMFISLLAIVAVIGYQRIHVELVRDNR